VCHQTVGLIARQLEAAGISTVSLTSARDITRAVNPPRSVFLDYPLGHTAGRPHQPGLNKEIVASALAAFDQLTEPGSMVHLPHHWADTDDWKDRVMRPNPASDGGSGEMEDDRVGRHPDPQYQSDADAQAALLTHDGESCLVCAGIDY
jgi:hypothetical protein